MHGGLYLAAVGRVAPAACRIVGAMHLDNVAALVFDDALSGDEVGIAQPHLFAGREPVVLRRRNLAEIVVIDKNFARERNLASSGRWIFGVVGHFNEFFAVR